MLEKINSGLQKISGNKKSGYLMTVNCKELLCVSLLIFLILLYYFLNFHHHQLILFINVSQMNLFPFCLSSWFSLLLIGISLFPVPLLCCQCSSFQADKSISFFPPSLSISYHV